MGNGETPTYQDDFPEEEQYLLDRKVWSVSAAELGNDSEEHHRKAVITRYWQH